MKSSLNSDRYESGNACNYDGLDTSGAEAEQRQSPVGGGSSPLSEEVAEAAHFPAENPNPVFRVGPDCRVSYSNAASRELMQVWRVANDRCVPALWRERFAGVLASGKAAKWDTPCGDRILQLHCVPVADRGYLNVYASDVTEQGALLGDLAEEKRRTAALAEALRRERDLEQTVMEHTSAALVYLDRDFNFARINSACEVACQRPRAEMLGRNYFELFPNTENEAIFRRARDTGEPVQCVARPFEFADQPWRGVTYWDWTLTPVRSGGGEVEGFVFSLVDVTERVRAKQLSDALNDIHAAIASQLDFDAIMRTVLDRSAAALSCSAGAIGLRQDGGWVLSYGVGVSANLIGMRFSDDRALVSVRVAATRRPVAVLEGERTVEVDRKLMARYGMRAVLALPLIARDEVIGVLTFNYSSPRSDFSEAELDFASKLATAVSLALENARVLELESAQRRAAEMRAAEFEATLDAINDGVALYDMDGRLLRINAAAERTLGYHPGKISLSLAERAALIKVAIVDDPHAGVAQFPLPRALRGETVRSQLMRFTPTGDPEGQERYVLASAVPVLSPGGEQLGVAASFVDVTELRRARDELEQRVRERTAELEAIFESVPDALYVADGAGILRSNRAGLENYGCNSVEQLREKLPAIAGRMESRYADTGEPIPPAELGLARALRGERSVQEVLTHNPIRGGDQIHRVAAGPIVLRGQVVAAVAHETDITEQKRAEQQLAYQANLLANVNDAILAYDAGFRVTAWNRRAEELYGWTAEEAIGTYAPEITGSKMTEAERAESLRQLAETGRWQGEVRHTRRDGTPIIVESTSMALRDKAGRIHAFATVHRDITRRKEIELQNARLLEEVGANREQLQALSRRLVAMQEAERSYVADQLYNQAGQVLAALRLQLLRMSREDVGSAARVSEMDATLGEAMRELHDLASQLRPVSLSRSTLARALRELVVEFGKLHGLAVRYEPGDTETLRPPADVATAIFRSVQEGLANVIRHAQGTAIALELRSDGDHLIVTLADDGIGFDFGQAGLAGGLGLASMRERLKAVGGQLTVTSGPAGTTLQLHAPLGQAQLDIEGMVA